ncbi:hypothetical protein McanCB56680_006441 [Microsporum canis]|uniref:Uncharacterized protein n=1 Tax=Arthroderma otae (strain ATCC MYA-4605 / CBS 113480) TaxID=554155 RepID=C5FVB4_ARTOC|nr:conserved hypothetical protein [Microsporum canis CBS 113480]EEQ33848.1 conserved hypothetical protein [Microsporum canis CBS 113480]
MSGEEEFDEFMEDEFLWIDAGDPHFTDEMAMLINPDPVFLDDEALYDALDSDTDWEYLSDEYYDNDLPLKLRRRQEKAAAIKGKRESQKPAALDNTRYYGVSWSAGPRVENNGPLYQPGEGVKVSLLKNWREIFHESKPKTKQVNEKIKHDGHIRATFHDRLSTRPRRDKRGNVPVNGAVEIGVDTEAEGDVPEMDVESNGLVLDSTPPVTIPLPPSRFGSLDGDNEVKKPAKRGRGRPRIRGGGSRLKEVTPAPEEQKRVPGLEIVPPSLPINVEEYKVISAPNAPTRGRKRSAVEQATPAPVNGGPGPSSSPVRNPKRRKHAVTNGVSTAASSRPTRSSTRRK